MTIRTLATWSAPAGATPAERLAQVDAIMRRAAAPAEQSAADLHLARRPRPQVVAAMSIPNIYVAIEDGDFTVWLLANCHAWPFDYVADALFAAPDIEAAADPQASGWGCDDHLFAEQATAEDVWWDRVPEPEDSDLVAQLLAGGGSDE